MIAEPAEHNVSTSDDSPVLVYDGECPVCSAYVRWVRLRDSVGPVELINARDGGPMVEKIRQANLDLDEGMVLWYGKRFYHGADCINMLAMLSSGSGFFNRMNAAIFSKPRLAAALYPVLRAGRNTLLRILGRSRLTL
jgi:predicted DCC family thiol-disulfide oxidoreductase YuxK